MTWFAFPGGWGDYNLNGVSEKQLAATGAHGYATQAEADAHVNASPNPAQEIVLQALKLDSVSPLGAGVSGDNQTPNSTGGVSGAVSNLTGNAFNLTFGNTTGLLTRILKITFGGILIIAGIMKLTGAGNKLESVIPVAGKVLAA